MPTDSRSASPPPRPDYGIDAPGVIRNLLLVAAGGIGAFLTAHAGLWTGVVAHVNLATSGLFAGLGCGVMGVWMLYDSRIGKLRERDRLLDLLPWRGDEAVLDVGCGRGLMLIGAAQRVPRGTATGLDLWRSEDLTGNSAEATKENARREGVAERVVVQTGDMRQMPFPDGSFDAIVSNVAIHNIDDPAGRAQALKEIARVLRPGGGVVIHDIRHGGAYADALRAGGLADVRRVGSKAGRAALAIMSFGALRPDIVVGRKPAA